MKWRFIELSPISLSFMRIGIALIILADLLLRIPDIQVFYTDMGALPSDELYQRFWKGWRLCFHTLSSDYTFQIVLFIIAAIAALFLLIGYHTRIATVISWLMIMSLHNRNPMILQGGDDLLRLTLFWNIFTPWGAYFSIDSKRKNLSSDKVPLFAGLAFMLQVSYVYGVSALEKGPEWYSNFNALYYAYHLDQIAYAPALYLAQFPILLKTLTAMVWWIELIIPFLLFMPFKNTLFRMIGIILIIGFHLWNGISIQVGLFFLIGIVTAFGLIPDEIIRKISNPQSISISPEPEEKKQLKKFILNPFILLTTIYVLIWNYSNLTYVPYVMNQTLRIPGNTIRLDQNWGMFAPGVFKEDGWYIYEGITTTGDTIDIMNNGIKVVYSKPQSIVKLYRTDRWRKFAEQYYLPDNNGLKGYYAQYLKNKWNKENPEKYIKQLRVIYMLELTPPPGDEFKIKPVLMSTAY